MNNKSREFVKWCGLAGAGLVGAGLPELGRAGTRQNTSGSGNAGSLQEQIARSKRQQRFNMSGYAAPKLETVRIGFIGLGQRGPGAVIRMSHIQGVEIKALCDIRPDRVEKIKKSLEGSDHRPDTYSGSTFAWKEVCERDDIDLIYICTPWDWHVPMAVYAMENDKHAVSEVPIATTLEDCWQLVETSEKTRKHCMMLENCCYDFFELLTLNMARQGYFGEIIHGEGAYLHNLLGLNFNKEGYYNMWRLKENFRDGNLYPTHGLGPVCQVMNINRGDQMDYLVSLSSADFHMAAKARELAQEDDFFASYANKRFRGNINTTSVRTKNGRSIMIQHDVSSPRPYSRIHLVSGTKGIARKWPDPAKIANGHSWVSEEEFKKLDDRKRTRLNYSH